MAEIAVNPFQMVDCLFKVGNDQYEAHVSQVEFAPSTQSATFKGLKRGSSFTFTGTAEWVCNLAFAQDWETANSLARYLFDNEGEEIAVEFEPKSGGASIYATLIVTPGSIGGTVDAVATSSVALGVQGKPSFTPPAP